MVPRVVTVTIIVGIKCVPMTMFLYWLGSVKEMSAETVVRNLFTLVMDVDGIFALLLFDKDIHQRLGFRLGTLVYSFFIFAFISALLAESFIDLYYIIPDSLSIYASVAIVGMWGLETVHPELGIGFVASVLGAFFGGGTLAAIALLWLLIRH